MPFMFVSELFSFKEALKYLALEQLFISKICGCIVTVWFH